jgi:damage-control phosphatase, subfamily I
MRTFLDCIPCFMIQALRTGRLVGLSDEKIHKLLIDLGGKMKNIKMDDPPPKTAVMVYDLIKSYTGETDPFKTVKKQATEKVLSLYPQLKKNISESDDPLGLAIRLAITGNVIDFGISSNYDLESEIQKIMDQSFGRWDEEEFKKAITQADWILYLGDNTGETVFDRLLIETMARTVTYVVREKPIINDATREDALAAGLDKTATIISSGCAAPGTVLDQCTPEFLELFRKAPFIISKGQGNYETLSDSDVPIFFLLKAKCNVVARHLGVKKGDLVLASAHLN